MSIFERYQARYEASREEVLSLDEYLQLCKATPAPMPGPPSGS
jgi:serine protein kinase